MSMSSNPAVDDMSWALGVASAQRIFSLWILEVFTLPHVFLAILGGSLCGVRAFMFNLCLDTRTVLRRVQAEIH
jgi:hypothetical protein